MIKRIRVANLGWLGLSLFVVAIDQLSKQWVLANLTPLEAIRVFPFFNILLSYNTGAAFGFLNAASGWQQWLFGSVAAVVSAVIIVSLLIQTRWHWFMSLGLALILGGALGNLYDRMTRGFVVDFLHLHIHEWSWPIFNLADTAICIGAGLLLIDIFLQREGR